MTLRKGAREENIHQIRSIPLAGKKYRNKAIEAITGAKWGKYIIR